MLIEELNTYNALLQEEIYNKAKLIVSQTSWDRCTDFIKDISDIETYMYLFNTSAITDEQKEKLLSYLRKQYSLSPDEVEPFFFTAF